MREERLILFESDRLELRFSAPSFREHRRTVLFAELERRIAAIDERCERLVISGGSPLAHPDFDRIVERCRARGVPALALETDAAALSAPDAIERLKMVGISLLFVVHGAISESVHSMMAWERGLSSALRGIENAIHGEIPVYFKVPIARTNFEEATLFVEALVLGDRPPRGILLAPADPTQVPYEAADRVVPWSDIARLAARVFALCHDRGVEYGFSSKRGVAACAAGGALDRFGTVFHDRFTFFQHARAEALVRVPACDACSLNSSCRGIEARYAELFGSDELLPVPLEVSMDWRLRKLNRLDRRDYKHVSAFSNEADVEPRSLVRVNGHCNMSCSFCFVDRTVADFPAAELEPQIETLFERGARHLVLSGGEPTLHPELPRLIEHGARLGFSTIEIQTNGVRAAARDYAQSLVDSGLNKVTVSLHSVDAVHSDKITRLPNAFGKTIEGLHNFRALGVITQIAHVITKSNYRELPSTVRFFAREFPCSGGRLSICFAIAQGISDLTYQWVIPTFSEIRPYMREALDICLIEDIGFGGMIGQGGYPPCMLDGQLEYYENKFEKIFRSEDFEEQFYKAPRCSECSFDGYCIGVRRSYVDAYGDAEIRPFRAEVRGIQPIPRASRGSRRLAVVRTHGGA